MLETLFFLDKIVINAALSYFSNSYNTIGTLVGIWIVVEVLTSKQKKNKKEGKK